MKEVLANELINFIDESPSVFHAVENMKNILKSNNFKELSENEKWQLKKDDKYFISKNNSSIIAFQIGEEDIYNHGYRIICAHADSPCFSIKPKSEIITEGSYVTLNTEGYGGVLLSTWFDRPLTMAGKVMVRGDSPFNPTAKLLYIDRPILIIPSLAIHLNREVNDGYKYNKQKDTLPLLTLVNDNLNQNDYLLSLLSSTLQINKEEILDYDLFLLPYEKGCVAGLNNEFISIRRLDDLWMAFAGLKSFIDSKESKCTKVLACFDNEEIGSLTSEGANSNFLKNILERINFALKNNDEEFKISLSKSIAISADVAHALHPNYTEKHDPTNKAILGKGPMIKYSGPKSYITNSLTGAMMKECCIKSNVPYQTFVNRSDSVAGKTVGPFISSSLCIPTADVGTPVLAMHSARELGAVEDNLYIIKTFTTFYEL